MFQDLFVIGATGKIGNRLITDVLKANAIQRIVGVASSTSFIYSREGIEPAQASAFIKRGETRSCPYLGLDTLLDAADGYKGDQLVFVDVTDEKKAMTPFHLKVIEDTGHCMVTANKNPIALSSYDVFERLTREPKRYGYRCSVMAGADAVPFLQDLRDLGDSVIEISGCFSGTLGYITSELKRGKKPFSDILQEAKDNQYTEPDPRDDLNALDVARKLIVLVRSGGYRAELSDMVIEPFIPQSYFRPESVGDFMESVKELDGYFEALFYEAGSCGETLKYVGSFDQFGQPRLSASLKRMEKDSAFGSLNGTLNKIVIISRTYDSTKPYSIEAPGAGVPVTAQNVRRDLFHLLPERRALRELLYV